ncbi:hypothetical protein AERO9A_300061 [Aeromonas salmonicida]|nr:hypothetical protein AERO9A_300061 [Aeromonas salmonicida]
MSKGKLIHGEDNYQDVLYEYYKRFNGHY